MDIAQETFAENVARRKAESRVTTAEALLRELGIPAARAESQFYTSLPGEVSPYVRQLMEVLRGVTGSLFNLGRIGGR